MITDWQIQKKGDLLILGIATEDAVRDLVSDRALLATCLAMLESAHTGLVNARMGHFGRFAVTLNFDTDDRVSIFIDGPEFDSGRVQSAAIWIDKEGLRNILHRSIDSP
jgi:hypothetical protein